MTGNDREREEEGAGAEEGKRTDNISEATSKENLLRDQEVEIFRDVLRREARSGAFPDEDDVMAMEESLYRLTAASVLFADLTTTTFKGPPPRNMGLSFLAQAMKREAIRLYRLYHGRPPRYL